jgi:hypothetical protein
MKGGNMENIEEKPLIEQMKELKQFREEVLSGEIKRKKLKLPRKAKVKGRKLKQGWIGTLSIDENRNISGNKVKLIDSAFKDKNGVYHASDGREIFFWEGKFPVLIQPTWKTNPINLDPKTEKNETYGDKYKMARMLSDAIKIKSQGSGSIIIWIIVGLAVLFGINYFMGGA